MSRERPRRATLPPAEENIKKLENVINEGNCYGAQQMYKSISARYVSAQRHSEALDILHSGACLQLKNGQVTCGSELAVIYVETLVKAKVPYDDDVLDCIRKIYKTFPQIPLPQDLGEDEDMQQLNEALGAAKIRVDCCLSFLKAAIKWSAEFGAHRNGSPELHVMLGEYVYSESPELDMTRVSYHFVRGNNPKKFASTLVNFMGKCYPGEDDLAIARAILMYLAMGNLRDANFLMDELKKHAQYKEHDLHRSDLIQFINHLLPTLQRDALPLFNMLRTKYKSSIDREPAFNERLDEIAELFYGVQRRNPLQGMFGDIFKVSCGLVGTEISDNA
ncbi:Golgi to ER traffic protein 4 [Populus alba x Populus x berolinensis]|nr:Golgi to ER traffic protein 4 [Populus alba x Populus x berolinensis]